MCVVSEHLIPGESVKQLSAQCRSLLEGPSCGDGEVTMVLSWMLFGSAMFFNCLFVCFVY